MQYLAMLSMLIDHIGIVFFPVEITYRIIGRLALPIYAFGIVQGFRHTSSFRRYVCRLMMLGAVSQIPFMLAVSDSEINIIGTLIFCLVVLKLLGSMKIQRGKSC
ncbi:TraX family protein [Paenibacillus sp. FSL W8-0919]|uniref:TraX family protein n=1 Tax=Paenibacillus sp. FSL W8-0919 TaxID=2954707 RepID=UPI0030FD05F3